jgi:hypothetical protein
LCDPVTATVISVGASALAAGGSLYEGSQAASQLAATQNAQNQANDAWVAYQKKIHDQEAADEAASREKATAAQRDTLSKISPQTQTQEQTTEQQRLNALYTKPGGGTAQDPSNPGGMLLSGEGTGNQGSIGDITSKINQATAQARQRISALATAGSYGGSFGGLGTVVPLALTQGGNAINLQNAIRQGDLKTYGVEQQVQPVNYAVGPGTGVTQSIAKALGGLAGTLAGSAGPKAISGFNVTPTMPTVPLGQGGIGSDFAASGGMY